MLRFVKTGHTGGRPGGPVDSKTTITYYELKRPQSFLAIVRFTAYSPDGGVFRVFEGVYEDDPEEFCRLERDIETALNGGIDASIQSEYEHEVFPVISSYLD